MRDVEKYNIVTKQVKNSEKSDSASVHLQNISPLAFEIFEVFNGSSPVLIKGIFQFRGKLASNLRQRGQFRCSPVHSVFNVTKSVKLLGPNIWKSHQRK